MFILITLLEIYALILLGRVLLSWFPNLDRNSPIVRVLFDLTEPVLQPIRNALPQTGMFDFSPIVAFLIIQVLQMLLRSF